MCYFLAYRLLKYSIKFKTTMGLKIKLVNQYTYVIMYVMQDIV